MIISKRKVLRIIFSVMLSLVFAFGNLMTIAIQASGGTGPFDDPACSITSAPAEASAPADGSAPGADDVSADSRLTVHQQYKVPYRSQPTVRLTVNRRHRVRYRNQPLVRQTASQRNRTQYLSRPLARLTTRYLALLTVRQRYRPIYKGL